MRITKHLRRRAVTWATAGLAVTAVAGALGLTAANAAPVTSARHSGAFTFRLVPSPGIKAGPAFAVPAVQARHRASASAPASPDEPGCRI